MKVKLSDILLLTLFFVMGSMIFAIKKSQKSMESETPYTPLPSVKPEIGAPALRLELSSPEKAGSYGRLSVDEFLTRGATETHIRDQAPKAAAEIFPKGSDAKHPDLKKKTNGQS